MQPSKLTRVGLVFLLVAINGIWIMRQVVSILTQPVSARDLAFI